jgi:carboxyl-terminal processing protease
MKYLAYLVILFNFPLCSGGQTERPSAETGSAFVEEFLLIAGANGLVATQPQWKELSAQARKSALGTKDSISAYPIVAQTLKALGDHHGGLSPTRENTEEYKRRYGKLWAEADSRQPTSSFMERKDPVAQDFSIGSVGIRSVIVPSVFTRDDEKSYALKLSKLLLEAPPLTCGYVIDLRGNVGGDMWPMLAALSPLLATDSAGAFTSRTEPPVKWFARDQRSGQIHSDGLTSVSFTVSGLNPPLRLIADLPVAVLLDDGVLSSGEAAAIAFVGRKETRSFGTHTYGLSTVNSSFTMRDGTTLYLSTGVYQDRLGHSYPEGVTPDVPIVGKPGADDPALVVSGALAWLKERPACQLKAQDGIVHAHA